MRNDKLNIAYIEYLNTKEELLYFKNLISEIGLDTTKRLNLYFVSHLATNDDIMDLAKCFNQIFYCQSYKHSKFTDEFVDEIQLGIVPSLYEFNISQSAVEFISRKIPILCGDKGGDWEFCKNDLFKFNTKKPENFKNKLLKILDKPELLNQYWLDENEVAIEFVKREMMMGV